MFQTKCAVLGCALALSLCAGIETAAAPLGTAFTYQGQLKEDGAPANGEYDMVFLPFTADVGGMQVGGLSCEDNVLVANGLFIVELQFDSGLFNGDARWLEIRVRPDGTPGNCISGVYTILDPRQPINATPYALHSLNAPNGRALDAADGSPTNALFVDNNGNIGIGTAAPSTKLHVVDGVGVSPSIHPNAIAAFQRNGSAFLYVESSEAGVGGLAFGHPGKSLVGAVVFGDAGTPEGLQFHSGGASRMAITAAGNVGIGVTGPAQKLHVAGTVQATGFRLPTGAAAGKVLTSDASGNATWQPVSPPHGAAVYQVNAAGCDTVALTLASTCQTPLCSTSPLSFLNCAGACPASNPQPATCPNTLIGYLTPP